ncbi:MAG TPA: malectin domain-containing carbohydrate-binding protein [Verrucomicrobiae bacterium]
MAGVALAVSCWCATGAEARESRTTVILQPRDASWAEALAAREIRRYIYVRSGELIPINAGSDRLPPKKNVILVARKSRPLVGQLSDVGADVNRLGPQCYLLKTVARPQAKGSGFPVKRLMIVGGDDAGVLYGAYRFAEVLGVRFYLEGDVIPDERMKWELPLVDEHSRPLFALRGIQPFHDFPEGPDWWNRDDYLAVIGQLPKLRMNFIGLHTYPEGRPNAEPTVWIGRASDIGEKGAVKFSYPSSYQNTLRGNWGYVAKKTGEYIFGSSQLFERDGYGAEVMAGFMPQPTTPEECNEVFDRTSAMLRDAFSFAHQVGVKTCVGTETPLVIPKLVQQRLKDAGANPSELSTVQALYAGIFRRAALAYPLDYYWFWTPEDWTWSGTKDEAVKATMDDLAAAIAAHKAAHAPFGLATCGWVLGPQQDRAMFDKTLPKEVAVSCINREVGKTPVEPGFAEVHGRAKWAIPWMEDDPALTSLQLWVGRMRRDAADALRYGCDGLMGIHWRTRALGPNVSALAQAAWNQQPWLESYKPAPLAPKEPQEPGPVGGAVAAFPNNPIAGTEDQTLYQTVRYNVSAYHLRASNGICRVTLKFCEPHYGEAGKRVFDVKLQGQTIITNLDIFGRVGKNRALDYTFENILVTNGWVRIDFVPRVEFPSIAAIDIEGTGFTTRVNCGGPAYRDYAADAPASETVKQVYAETKDFYQDWARHEFGDAAGSDAAAIFTKLDCKLPVQSVWTDGPGGIQPDARPWDQVKNDYAFVDEFAGLRPRVRGAGAMERYDYWLNTLQYLRSIGQLNCAWGEYNRALDRVRAEKEPQKRQALAREAALPARAEVVRVLRSLYEHLLGTVSTPGELGTVMNWNQHNLPLVLTKPGEELARILGHELPVATEADMRYHGPVRVIVPTRRTGVQVDEVLELKVIVLSKEPPMQAELFWRTLGKGKFSKIPLRLVARGVYSAQLPPAGQGDFEYYVKVATDAKPPVYFPQSAPQLNQTVVVYGAY